MIFTEILIKYVFVPFRYFQPDNMSKLIVILFIGC